MRRILFVDDDQQVLDGLRDLLWKQRKEWQMVFVLGGQAALAELERGRFDVLVSDIRMPGMDGVALLQKAKDRFPTTARIILSGHSAREAAVDALPVAHQFLSKPCDVDLLRTVVARACDLQALLGDAHIRALVGRLEHLPSVPRTYFELTQAAGNPDVGLAEFAAIVERDTAMSVKVLQLVNSSYFGLAQRQTSVHQAVAYLGTDLLRALALSAHAFAAAAPTVRGFSVDALQAHSLLTARIARHLLRDPKRAAEAFTAALVHDIGKLVLATSMPERFAEVLRLAAETGRVDHVVEAEVLGATHAEVGAYLVGLWGLPLEIVEAVANHHHPERVPLSDTLVAVHVANALSDASADTAADPTAGGRLNVALVEASAFGPELPRWRVLAEAERRAVQEVDAP